MDCKNVIHAMRHREKIVVNSCIFFGNKSSMSQRHVRGCWVCGYVSCEGWPGVERSGSRKGEALIGDAVCLHGERGGARGGWTLKI